MKNLIAIDQTPLLQAAIKDLEAWHEKIERLEIEIQRFREHDLKLFSDWEQLTIQKYREEIDLLITSYQKLTDFHNWVVFTADHLNISIPHAFHLMTKEEELFQTGTFEQKEKIAQLRKSRQKALQEELDDEASHFAQFEDDEDKSQTHEERADKTREERINEARALHHKEIQYYERLSDKKIQKIMQDFEEGLFLLIECVGICLESFRLDLISKLWSQTPAKIKKTFNDAFKTQYRMTLDDFLKRATDQVRDEAGVDEDAEFDFSAHFENPFGKTKKEKPTEPEDLELAKIFYRRLMLKVHPDKLPPDFITTKKSWLDRLWKKIQTAYQDSNVGVLQSLHLQVLITLKKYDEVSYSELKEGAGLLEKEFKRTYESQRQTCDHPAWGFSQLKSYMKIEKEIVAPYAAQKKDIKKEISRIEKTHAALREYVQQAQQNGGFSRRRPPQKKRKKPSGRKPRHSSDQTNFFD